MVELRGYSDAQGATPFANWFHELDDNAAARVTTALSRLGLGNFWNVKGVGAGVFECRIDFGPGYRIYFGKDGDQLVILRRRDEKAPVRETSQLLKNAGRSINDTRNKRSNNAANARFQGDDPRARANPAAV